MVSGGQSGLSGLDRLAGLNETQRPSVSSEGRAKLRDWAVWPVRAGCYSWSALSFPHSKPLYRAWLKGGPLVCEFC